MKLQHHIKYKELKNNENNLNEVFLFLHQNRFIYLVDDHEFQYRNDINRVIDENSL